MISHTQQSRELATASDPRPRVWLEPSAAWSSRLQTTAKRCLDVTCASLAVLVLSPLIVVLALLIRCTSAGPAVFRQTRVGKNGRSFTLYKFRTMVRDNDPSVHMAYYQQFIAGLVDADGTMYKLRNDLRITRVGRFLRSTSLDELPQLWNVITGSLSLVGPRPPLPYEVEMYDDRARQRLTCKPGLTGLWQVSGRASLDFQQMIDLDLQYINNWTIWLDAAVLVRTPWAVLSGRGAA